MRGEAGFALIEMVVATVVLVVGVAGAVAAFGAVARASGVSAEREQAAILAERHLAEVEASDPAALAAGSGDFGEDAPGYQWEQEILPTDTEGLSELRLTVRWKSGEDDRSAVVSTYVLQAVAE